MKSNPDCTFHPTDDSAMVQKWLDDGISTITDKLFTVDRQLIFTEHVQFFNCQIFVTRRLMAETNSWYKNNHFPSTSKRFFNCDIAFGNEIYHYNSSGQPGFKKYLHE